MIVYIIAFVFFIQYTIFLCNQNLSANHLLFMILSVYDRLEDSGYSIGQRVTELIGMREHIVKRETRIVNMLQVQLILQEFRIILFALILHMTLSSITSQFVSNVVWRHLFNKTADNLERSMENEDECMVLPYITLIFSIACLMRFQRCLCALLTSA